MPYDTFIILVYKIDRWERELLTFVKIGASHLIICAVCSFLLMVWDT